MNIIEKLRLQETGIRRVERTSLRSQQIFKLVVDETDNVRDFGLCEQKQYRLVATVEVHFWANAAQLTRHQEQAEIVLLRELYGDAIPLLEELHLAINNQDDEEALRLVQMIKREIIGA